MGLAIQLRRQAMVDFWPGGTYAGKPRTQSPKHDMRPETRSAPDMLEADPQISTLKRVLALDLLTSLDQSSEPEHLT